VVIFFNGLSEGSVSKDEDTFFGGIFTSEDSSDAEESDKEGFHT
jgi:hypothetical protein